MDKTGKIIRIIAIILMGLTAVMNVLGGAGTSCAAFSNKVEYRMAFRELLDYRWLYQGLVVTTILIGIAGIWMTVKLVRGGPTVYRNSLIVLVIGTLLSGVHFYASMALRGKAAPANMKFYANLITLILFLVIRFTKLREKVDFSGQGSKNDGTMAGGISAFVSGLVTLTVFVWAGPSHTYLGESWVELFTTPIIYSGVILTTAGFALMVWSLVKTLTTEMILSRLCSRPLSPRLDSPTATL